MPVDDPPTTRSAVARQLTEQFAGLLPADVVTREVADAVQELQGQIPTGSLAEMLHRLAAYRLRGWAVARR